MRKLVLVLISLFYLVTLFSQTFKGKIVNSQNEAIPHVTIFIKELTTGTSTNENGDFEINIPQGTYTCNFQHLSYQTVIRTVSIPVKESLIISMQNLVYDLPTISVGKNQEDPAYNIMRRAIGMAPFYRKQLSLYNAEVYIKGTLKIDKISRLVKNMAKKELKNIQIKEGQTYLQESLSEIEYKQGKYNQKIVSISNSFPEQFGDIKLTLANYNIYEQKNEGLISPLSSQAFSYYNFKYEGFSYEGEHVVNKIQVIPKYKNAISFRGHIYIVEGYWSVYSFQLINKQFGVEFTNKQTYGELAKKIWMPVSNHITADISIMGNKGSVNYTSSVKYTNFVISPQLQASLNTPQVNQTDEIKQSEKQEKINKKIETISTKDNISNREAYKIYKLMEQKEKEDNRLPPDSLKEKQSLNLSKHYNIETDSTAKNMDSVYWNKLRPIPLMKNEQISYKHRDSIKNIAVNKDTTLRKNSVVSIIGGVFLGKNYKVDSSLYIEHKGLINIPSIEYNLVDGWKYNQSIVVRKRFKDTTSLSVSLDAGYAFARNKFLYQGEAIYNYWPEKRAIVFVRAGNQSMDFNFATPLSKFENTIYTLFLRKNFASYFNNTHIDLGHSIEIVNGLTANFNLGYHNRERLENNTDYSFFYKKNNFRQNTPLLNPYVREDYSLVNDHKASIMYISLSYTPQTYYYKRGRNKRNVRSEYPTFSMSWKKGFEGIFNSKSNFDQLEASIKQTLELGIMESFTYNIIGGYFPNNKQMHFRDFKNFNIKEFQMSLSPLNESFNLLKTYMPGTNEWYVNAFFQYTTPYLVIKRLPLINKTMIQENLSLYYLNTPYLENYTEIGYSLTNIGLVGSAGVFVGFEKAKYYNWGFKISIDL